MKDLKLYALISVSMLLSLASRAQNPIVQTWFTPDPAPMVYNDTVFLFTDHDEDDAQYFKMKDWQLYSTTDMVNWTYRGTPISTATFPWAKQGDNAWAAQAVERNGKFYWYVCAEDTVPHVHGIGVAVADAPEGPYRDPLQRPLVPGAWGYIDPSIFIDDDDRAYLFWGNNGLWYARLNDDMISLATEVRPVEGLNDEKAFGPLKMKYDYAEGREKLKTNYEEGPWVFKRGGLYYLVYAAGGVPEHLAYSTSPSIDGPWTYAGRIMDEAEASFTIHAGSIEYHGRNFMFYHNGNLPNGGGFRRSTCVEEFAFNADGSIPFIPFTKEGVRTPVRNLNPYQRVEAETMAASYGLKTDRRAGSEHYLTSIHNGDWLRLRAVDFGSEGTARFMASVAAISEGGSIELRLDNLGGDIIGELPVRPTGGTDRWQEQATSMKSVQGVHDLYFLFKGGDDELFRVDYWQFLKHE
ncbi:MAG: glycoside hydrolase family 43 protein [Bacteroides sp.]|nr:glycoside hydrolase family 43 protein [Bacteroides sp.]